MRVTVAVELAVDGVALAPFPYVHRLELEDVAQLANWLKPAEVYAPVPGSEALDDVLGVLLAPQEQVCVRLNGQRDGDIVLEAGGVLIAWDVLLDDAPLTNVTVLNPQPHAVEVLALLGGRGVEAPDVLEAQVQGEGFGEGGAGEQPFGGET